MNRFLNPIAKLPANPTTTPTDTTKTSNPRLAQDDPQDPVQLARTETHTAIEMQDAIRKKQCWIILIVVVLQAIVLFVIFK